MGRFAIPGTTRGTTSRGGATARMPPRFGPIAGSTPAETTQELPTERVVIEKRPVVASTRPPIGIPLGSSPAAENRVRRPRLVPSTPVAASPEADPV